MVTCGAAAPLERTGANRRIVEGCGIGILRGAQNMLRHDEGVGQEREVGCKRALHFPGDLRGRDNLDVANERVTRGPPAAEVRVDDELQRILHVLGGEGFAVMPFDVVAQLDAPFQAVLGNTAILDGWNFRGEAGRERAVRSNAEQRVEKREVNAVIHLDARHQRVEDRGLLREADHDAAGRSFGRRCAEGRPAEKVRHEHACGGGEAQHLEGLATCRGEFLFLIGHAHVPLLVEVMNRRLWRCC
ncbi:hypothetical protein RHAB21_03760 [Pseudorhizobium halotolerans]|uniref:Uncharacterized protein n=1 Tax=Pseudorhizobium halotolerans TaxID=1233081 RepID=A0ABN7JWP2_9HYPH|nr:hypothetical protein RHAB21_03760 [Pseudorhizobium halotolerans]